MLLPPNLFSIFADLLGNLTHVEKCGSWVGEFALIYDVSNSFGNDLVNVKRLAPILFADLEREFPGSKFGVGTFSDKGIYRKSFQI